mmetsp:Transcript_14396/g.14009  ORF Transcript_14396/g.14009 Transcript_14396/m.14009 type:complete len:80 (-) Transcript_14396:875-1114(-)
MVLQNLEGDMIKQAMGDILTNTLSRLTMKPMSPCFQRILVEVFLSAMLLDVDQTLSFLINASYLNEFFTTLFTVTKQFE